MWVNVLVAVLAVIVGLVVMVILAGVIIENAQVREDLDPVPPSAGLRPEEKTGETKRTFVLREAYVVRRATREDILAAEDHKRAMALIRDAGGC